MASLRTYEHTYPSMWKDPLMVQALALMQAGKMPKLSEIKAGVDLMCVSTAPSVRM